MEIALVMEYSTCAKNQIVYETLKRVAEKNGHHVTNYGQFDPEDNRQTYIQNAFFLSALLNSKAADFVVTGCGTGQGALVAANACPGVVCGLCADPSDSFLYTQINNGNCISIPYAKGWGWAGEVNLEYLFEKLFIQEPGGGYPESSAASEQENAKRTVTLKKYSHPDYVSFIKSVDDRDLLERFKAGFAGSRYDLFREKCQVPEILKAVDEVLAKG